MFLPKAIQYSPEKIDLVASKDTRNNRRMAQMPDFTLWCWWLPPWGGKFELQASQAGSFSRNLDKLEKLLAWLAWSTLVYFPPVWNVMSKCHPKTLNCSILVSQRPKIRCPSCRKSDSTYFEPLSQFWPIQTLWGRYGGGLICIVIVCDSTQYALTFSHHLAHRHSIIHCPPPL